MERKEAIEVVKKNWPDSSFTMLREALETLIPELKESVDERIRKDMIETIKKEAKDFPSSVIAEKSKSWIAWLEAQGEHTKFRDSIQVGDRVTRNKDGVLVNLSQLNRVAKKDEKQGERKPPIEKLPEEMKTIGESLGFTTQEECDNYNQMVTDLIMSDDDKGEQKPAWSEEDKCMINNIIDTLKPLSQVTHSGYAINSMITWLKSFKDRVQH